VAERCWISVDGVETDEVEHVPGEVPEQAADLVQDRGGALPRDVNSPRP